MPGNFVRPNRNGPLPPQGPPRKKFSEDRRAINQDPVDDFYPADNNFRNQRPGPKRPKRRPESSLRPPGPPPKKGFSLKNPFKEILNNSPLKPRFPPKKKGGRFRPPTKTFNGFNPTFKGSVSFEEARRQYEKEKMEAESVKQFHNNKHADHFNHHDEFEANNDNKHVEKPRKKR